MTDDTRPSAVRVSIDEWGRLCQVTLVGPEVRYVYRVPPELRKRGGAD